MILHIPHASLNVEGKEFLCDLRQELLRMSDRYTDEIFDHPEATRIIAPISRLICDMERFEDDALEEMAVKGMGVCYTTNSFGTKLREVSPAEKTRILETYYRPHHHALEKAVEKELITCGHAIMVDCHSFSNVPLPHEYDQSTCRPDICIGTDPYHTPQWLIEKCVMFFLKAGLSVKLNAPFAGTLVPMKFYHSEPNVYSIMIEINRDLYMDVHGQKNDQYTKICTIIQDVLQLLMNETTKFIK